MSPTTRLHDDVSSSGRLHHHRRRNIGQFPKAGELIAGRIVMADWHPTVGPDVPARPLCHGQRDKAMHDRARKPAGRDSSWKPTTGDDAEGIVGGTEGGDLLWRKGARVAGLRDGPTPKTDEPSLSLSRKKNRRRQGVARTSALVRDENSLRRWGHPAFGRDAAPVPEDAVQRPPFVTGHGVVLDGQTGAGGHGELCNEEVVGLFQDDVFLTARVQNLSKLVAARGQGCTRRRRGTRGKAARCDAAGGLEKGGALVATILKGLQQAIFVEAASRESESLANAFRLPATGRNKSATARFKTGLAPWGPCLQIGASLSGVRFRGANGRGLGTEPQDRGACGRTKNQ